MTKMDRKILHIDDKESKNLKDEFSCSVNEPEDSTTAKPRRGFVSILDKETGECLVDKKPCDFGGTGTDNMIVWNGREIIPQVLFDKDRNASSGQKDLNIRWLSLGTGGCDAVNVLDPIAPDSPDVSLNAEIVIDDTNANYTDSGKKKPFDSVEFEQDAENANRHLIVKVTTTILYAEANINDLSEAALWFSDTNDPLSASVFELFARVTFSTIRKHENRELVILWYIYF